MPAFKFLNNHWKVTRTNFPLKLLRGDGEYGNGNWLAYSKEEGFRLYICSAHSEKAWLAERYIGMLRGITMAQLEQAGASMRDWGFAMLHADYLIGEMTTVALPPPLNEEHGMGKKVTNSNKRAKA